MSNLEKGFKLPKFGTVFAFLTDGVEGVAIYAVEQFNKQVLSKVKSPDDLRPYVLDLQAIIVCIRAILANHSGKIEEGTRKAAEALLTTLENLAKSLEDMNLTVEEFNRLLDDVRATIKAFKEA